MFWLMPEGQSTILNETLDQQVRSILSYARFTSKRRRQNVRADMELVF